MADNDIDLNINVDTKDAISGIKKFGDTSESVISKVSKGFAAFAALAGAALTFKGLSSAIDAASEADQSVQKLNISLASTGEFTKSASEEIQAYAESVQGLTGISDEAVLEAFSLAKAFGITNKQAKELTQGAIELSAATGVDLDSAVKQLGATYSGSVGKLAKYGTEFKSLTEQQLKSGEAVRLVNERFKGTAEALSNTFTGSVTKAGNAFGDILENLGKIITQNPAVIAGITGVANAFNQIAKSVSENQAQVSSFVSTLIGPLAKSVAFVAAVTEVLIDSFNGIIDVIRLVLIGINTLVGYIETGIILVFEAAEKSVLLVIDAFLLFVRAIVETASKVPFLSKAFDSVGISIDGVSSYLKSFTNDLTNRVTGKTDSFAASLRKNMAKAADEAGQSIFNLGESVKTSASGFKKYAEIFGVESLKVANAVDGMTSSIVDNTKGIKNLKNSTEDYIDVAKELEKVKGSYDKLKGALDSLDAENNKRLKSEKELINLEYEKGSQLIDNARTELQLLGKSSAETEKLIGQYKEALDIKKSLATSEFGGRFAEFAPKFKRDLTEIFGQSARGAIDALENIDLTKAASSALGVLTTALKGGDEKARFQGIGSVLTGALTAFIGPLGGVLGNFLTQLSQNSKEQTKQFIKEFVDSAPDFVKTLADNFPAIIEGLVDTLSKPEFWKRAAEAWFLVVRALYITAFSEFYKGVGLLLRQSIIESMNFSAKIFSSAMGESIKEAGTKFSDSVKLLFTQLGDVIKAAFTNIFGGLANAISNGFRNVIGSIGDVFRTAANEVRNAMFAPIERLISFLDNFSFPSPGGSGGGRGVIAEAIDRAFSKGGVVPKYASNGMLVPMTPRGTDTVPAMLTPGELVVPRNMVDSLGQFLSNNEKGGQSDAILMSILQALQQPMTVQAEATVNQSAFADIILQLNRQNARLSA